MTQKGHGVIRGRRDLLFDPKGQSDLCGRFDLVYDLPVTYFITQKVTVTFSVGLT